MDVFVHRIVWMPSLASPCKSWLRGLTLLLQRGGGQKSRTAGRGFVLEDREDFPWVKLFRGDTMSKNKFSEVLP